MKFVIDKGAEDYTAEDAEFTTSIIRYHAKVVGGGRIVIPEITRKVLGIERGNIVFIRVAKIKGTKLKNGLVEIETSDPVFIQARVGNKGLVTIPEEARKFLGIKVGDIVEVALEGVIRTKVGEVKKVKEKV